MKPTGMVSLLPSWIFKWLFATYKIATIELSLKPNHRLKMVWFPKQVVSREYQLCRLSLDCILVGESASSLIPSIHWFHHVSSPAFLDNTKKEQISLSSPVFLCLFGHKNHHVSLLKIQPLLRLQGSSLRSLAVPGL